MSAIGPERDVEEIAAFHAGLAHPARVAAMQALRVVKRMPLADLRREVSLVVGEMDTRTMQHHVYKMQVAGLVTVFRDRNRETVQLLRDVAIRVKGAPGA